MNGRKEWKEGRKEGRKEERKRREEGRSKFMYNDYTHEQAQITPTISLTNPSQLLTATLAACPLVDIS